MNINIFCAAGPNILILSSLVRAHFPNDGDKRFLLGNMSMNLKHLPRDLLVEREGVPSILTLEF